MACNGVGFGSGCRSLHALRWVVITADGHRARGQPQQGYHQHQLDRVSHLDPGSFFTLIFEIVALHAARFAKSAMSRFSILSNLISKTLHLDFIYLGWRASDSSETCVVWRTARRLGASRSRRLFF